MNRPRPFGIQPTGHPSGALYSFLQTGMPLRLSILPIFHLAYLLIAFFLLLFLACVCVAQNPQPMGVRMCTAKKGARRGHASNLSHNASEEEKCKLVGDVDMLLSLVDRCIRRSRSLRGLQRRLPDLQWDPVDHDSGIQRGDSTWQGATFCIQVQHRCPVRKEQERLKRGACLYNPGLQHLFFL